MKLAILAGGRGTRLGLSGIPKSMVLVGGKPVLQYQIELAKRYGIEEIYILLGYMPESIINYFGNGERFGIKINYIIEKTALGTAGAIKQLEGSINEKFFVFYGDTVMDVDLQEMLYYDRQFLDHIGTILAHPNDHPRDSDLIEVDDFHRITAFHSKPHSSGVYLNNLVNACLYILSPNIFKYIRKGELSDFGKDIFPFLVNTNQTLMAYVSAEYIKDMGTFDRLTSVTQDVISGKVRRLNKKFKRKAIFLDRDGIINEEVNIVRTPDEFKLIDGVAETIVMLNKSEYLAIIITNQPGIAKGFHTPNLLKEIHKKMEYLLGEKGAFIDRLYFCPHYPEKGFVGEVSEFKIDCDCRKPKIGMIEKAVQDFNIDTSSSYFIGDTTRDIQTAKNARMKSILLKTGHAGLDGKFDVHADFEFNSLMDAVNFILKK